MQTRGVKTTVAVGAIAVLALAGCSSDSGGGSDGGNAGTDVTVEEIGTMTDCGDLQGIVDAATEASDGDPLDALLLWDVPSSPGVVVPCRAIGVLQVEQNRQKDDPSERIRNDRVLAIPVEARREHGLTEVTALPARVRQELETFTIAATALEGKDVRIVGWGNATVALQLVRDSVKR